MTLVGVANNANIVYPDIAICQGVVHAVDALLLPVVVGLQDGA